MIAYLPELYPGELFYSWLARYYCHTTPIYTNAIGDILEKRTIRPDMEFINRLNRNAREMITKKIPMKNLILNHTMFPAARFMPASRKNAALESMIVQEGNVHNLLSMPKSNEVRYLKYCPVCVAEARGLYGEAYWSRCANIRNVDVCAHHGCRLKKTDIVISGKQSGRLYVAEAETEDVNPEFVGNGLELRFARYLTDVFQKPINMANLVDIGVFLNSKLEGSKYLSVRGRMRNVTLLFDDFMEFYKGLPYQGISQLSQIQKVFTGHRWGFYEICQIAYFLGVNVDELTNPVLPQKPQTKRFDGKVAELYAQGLGCHRIARELGCSPSTAKKANKVKPKAEHDHSVRKGMRREDWGRMDEDMVPAVRDACEQIFHNHGSRPGHVTVHAVCRRLGLPDKRFDYLPKCREVIHGYEEEKEVYWAREVVWCYRELSGSRGEDEIRWRDIRDITNLRRDNFIASFEYLHLFADGEMEAKIRNLLPV